MTHQWQTMGENNLHYLSLNCSNLFDKSNLVNSHNNSWTYYCVQDVL